MPDGLMIVTDGKTASTSKRLLIGQIGGAHGVRGLVRVNSFTADPADLTAYGRPTDASGAPIAIDIVGKSKGQLMARIDGVTDRTGAERWRGVELFIERDLLPEPDDDEDFYHADLIGLSVEDLNARALGTVRAVHDFGAGDVLEIRGGAQGELYLPFTHAVVPTVDLAGGRLIADPPVEVGDPEPQGGTDGAKGDQP